MEYRVQKIAGNIVAGDLITTAPSEPLRLTHLVLSKAEIYNYSTETIETWVTFSVNVLSGPFETPGVKKHYYPKTTIFWCLKGDENDT